MKNTKTIKTILFASLIAAMILPFGMMDYASAKQQVDKIPEDKLIDRPNNWKDKYDSPSKYVEEDSNFHKYVNDSDHPDNKWNKITKKNQIIMYNFDSMADVKNTGLNALLIDVQNQKDNGDYNPTEAERRFHEWAAQIAPNPVLPDVKPSLIEKVVQTYNESANHGHVPKELFQSDSDFWSNVVADKLCEYNKDCNTADPQNGIDPMCEFVNCALADTLSIGHLLSINMEVSDCWGTTSCYFADSKWLIGDGSLSISSGDGHSAVKTVEYYINDMSSYYPDNESHTAYGTVSLGYSSYNIPSSTANNSVTIDSSHYFSITCGGSNPVNCGTYSLTAYADDVTIEY